MSQQSSLDLQFLLYKDTSANTYTVADFIASHSQPPLGLRPSLSQVGLQLRHHNTDYWPSYRTVGDMARLSFQALAVAQQLSKGSDAWLRIGIDDSPTGGFFHFSPADTQLIIRFISVDDDAIAHRYPWDATGHVVHAVTSRLQQLAQQTTADFCLTCALPEAVNQLTTQAQMGRQLYALMGCDYFLELY